MTDLSGDCHFVQAPSTKMNDLPDSVPTNLSKLEKTHEGEHHGDYGANIPITRSALLYSVCAAVNSVNLGYDIGVGTAAGRLVAADLNLTMTQRELFIGSLNFWAIFGSIFANYSTDRYGRRKTFIIAAAGFIVGCIIMSLSFSYGMLMLGRMLVGLGVGTGLAIDPLYIAEVTPARHRGELVTWSEIALNIGIVGGFTMNLIANPASDGREWRIMFLVGCILPSVMIFLALRVMPESPRWLVANNCDGEARNVLKKIYPEGFDVDKIIQDIREAIAREAAAEQAKGWNIIMSPSPAIRRMLMVGVGIAVAQQAVGIDAIQYYLLDVIEGSGIKNHRRETAVLILLGLVKLVFIIIGGKLFDVRGRRPLVFFSLIGMCIALLVIGFAFFLQSNLSTQFILFGTAFYLAFFSIGMGPGAWLVASEVFAVSIRAKAMSVATCANRVTATLMSSTFLSTSKAMGWPAFFLMLAIICVIVLVYLYTFMPETKGRSLEDMSVYFAEIVRDTSILEAEAKIRGERSVSVEMSNPTALTSDKSNTRLPSDAEVL